MHQLSTANQPGGPTPIRVRNLEIKMAGSPAEIDAAQALRYQVFYQEMSAKPSANMKQQQRDFDRFDAFCDHLIILDHDLKTKTPPVIATYRFMRREAAKKCGQFYSQDEYNIDCLIDHAGEIMELGRSCVSLPYRNGLVMQLLWRGVVEYVRFYDVQLMFGCASLPGTTIDNLAVSLSYLHHFHQAPPELRAKALAKRYVNMNLLPKDQIDEKNAMFTLPPLIKGYLRLGGFIGDGAVIDDQFNTTDVNVVVKMALVTDKYVKHYYGRTE